MTTYTTIVDRASSTETRRVTQGLWRPWTLRRSALLTTIVLGCALFAVIAILQHIDAHHGALLFTEEGSSFGYGSRFEFRYLPTLVIVIFGIWVSWTDLDIRRLEPWFQLSDSRQAQGEPVHYRYDFDFILAVLGRSASAGHWIVFCSALMLILATMVTPPVLTAMFATQVVDFSGRAQCALSPGLFDTRAQGESMSHSFQWQVYNVLWLGQSLPPFATRDAVFTPVKVVDEVSQDIREITISSVRYGSTLDCWPPTSAIMITIPGVLTNTTQSAIAIRDDRGNVVNYTIGAGNVSKTYGSERYEAFFAPVQNKKPNMWFASFANISKWAPDFLAGGNATGLFCSTSYFSEPATVTYSTTGQVISYATTGPRANLSDATFNRTWFETIMGNPLGSENLQGAGDIPSEAAVMQVSQLAGMHIVPLGQELSVGFAMGSSRLDPWEYFEADKLSFAFASAQQISFAFALQQEFLDFSGSTETCVVDSTYEVVRLLPTFTIITQTFLASIVVICIYLFVKIRVRALLLEGDIDSIASVMAISGSAVDDRRSNLLDSGKGEYLKVEGLPQKRQSFAIVHESGIQSDCHERSTEYQPCRRFSEIHECVARSDSINFDLVSSSAQYPIELRRSCLLTVCLIIIGLLTTISIFSRKSVIEDGLAIPSTNLAVQQLILKFLPTIFATVLSTYLGVLCRSYSLLTPYIDLRYGSGRISLLLARYTSVPSSVVFYRALPRGQYVLSALSISVLVSHLLTVALAGLFSIETATIGANQVVYSMYSPAMLRSNDSKSVMEGIQDAVNIVVSNMTQGVLLPTWTTYDYAYLPLDIVEKAPNLEQIEIDVLGFGIDAQCHNVFSAPTSQFAAHFDLGSAGRMTHLQFNMTAQDGSHIVCGWGESDASIQLYGIFDDEPQKVEVSDSVHAMKSLGSSTREQELCSGLVALGWFRGSLKNNSSIDFLNNASGSLAVSNTSSFVYNATVIVCEPILKTRLSRLTIDTYGNILSAVALNDPTYDLPPSANFSASLHSVATAINYELVQNPWHKDSFARDWPNYFAKIYDPNIPFLDPAQNVVSYDEAVNMTSELMRRTFTSQVALDRRYTLFLNGTTLDQMESSNLQNASLSSQSADNAVPARYYSTVSRVFLSKTMSIIAQAVLAFDAAVLIVLALTLPKPFLAHMPSTIADQIALSAQSHAVDDIVAVSRDGRLSDLKKSRVKYGFGPFVGKDGKEHVGICRRQHMMNTSGDFEMYSANRCHGTTIAGFNRDDEESREGSLLDQTGR